MEFPELEVSVSCSVAAKAGIEHSTPKTITKKQAKNFLDILEEPPYKANHTKAYNNQTREENNRCARITKKGTSQNSEKYIRQKRIHPAQQTENDVKHRSKQS